MFIVLGLVRRIGPAENGIYFCKCKQIQQMLSGGGGGNVCYRYIIYLIKKSSSTNGDSSDQRNQLDVESKEVGCIVEGVGVSNFQRK